MRFPILIVLGAALAVAQNGVTYSAADAADGGRLYRQRCQSCHGPEGDQVSGADLGSGKFKRSSNEAGLIQIMRDGIEGTAMKPATNLSEEQARTVVAYLHSMAADPARSMHGDPARGKAVFESKGGCTNCHRISGIGSRFGPELSEIGASRRLSELQKSIVDPDAEILPVNRIYRVVTKDGQTITGRLLNLDTFTVQMIDQKERLLSFVKANLRSYGFVEKSPMPSFKDKLSAQEIADVVSYLASLKGASAP